MYETLTIASSTQQHAGVKLLCIGVLHAIKDTSVEEVIIFDMQGNITSSVTAATVIHVHVLHKIDR